MFAAHGDVEDVISRPVKKKRGSALVVMADMEVPLHSALTLRQLPYNASVKWELSNVLSLRKLLSTLAPPWRLSASRLPEGLGDKQSITLLVMIRGVRICMGGSVSRLPMTPSSRQ